MLSNSLERPVADLVVAQRDLYASRSRVAELEAQVATFSPGALLDFFADNIQLKGHWKRLLQVLEAFPDKARLPTNSWTAHTVSARDLITRSVRAPGEPMYSASFAQFDTATSGPDFVHAAKSFTALGTAKLSSDCSAHDQSQRSGHSSQEEAETAGVAVYSGITGAEQCEKGGGESARLPVTLGVDHTKSSSAEIVVD
ncbi:hypothetical protein PHYPSEUDO_012630 [Phytophthora pseudosyringae]|uniref:Uncharacterized protein n=1 Tax=Phytophthora pseudosyringae TaxID=221518 RepID=A0A8T1V9E4_9STRA|nr:hypothetical protein PHYPSEUDO_012630 [Phytophthora pseudosyringae]